MPVEYRVKHREIDGQVIGQPLPVKIPGFGLINSHETVLLLDKMIDSHISQATPEKIKGNGGDGKRYQEGQEGCVGQQTAMMPEFFPVKIGTK